MGRMDVKMKQIFESIGSCSASEIWNGFMVTALLFASLEFSVSANVGSELRASFDRALRNPLTRGHPTIKQPWRCALQQFSPCSAKCKKNLGWKLHQKKSGSVWGGNTNRSETFSTLLTSH